MVVFFSERLLTFAVIVCVSVKMSHGMRSEKSGHTAVRSLQDYVDLLDLAAFPFFRDLQNYMVWRFAMTMVVGLSRAYRDTRKAFRKVHSLTSP